jgi:hypothetical protein
MRKFLLAACAVLAMGASAAQAQSNDPFAGTWAFQSSPYGNEQFGVIMSGAMTATRERGDRYRVRLTANELIIAREGGESRMLTAHQNCEGVRSGEVLNITCRLDDAPDGYEPDNFLLQRGEGETEGQLVGSMTGNGTEVTFSRVR